MLGTVCFHVLYIVLNPFIVIAFILQELEAKGLKSSPSSTRSLKKAALNLINMCTVLRT